MNTKNFKRILSWILALNMIFSWNVPTYAANVDQSTCQHEFTKQILVLQELSCTEDGVIQYACAKCGAGNDYSLVKDAEGNVLNQIRTEALGHDLEITTTATCTQAGTRTETCKREGCDYTHSEAEDALPHDFEGTEQGTLVSAATCTDNAVYKRTCNRCKLEQNAEEPNTALGHQFPSAVDETTVFVTVEEANCIQKEKEAPQCTRADCKIGNPDKTTWRDKADSAIDNTKHNFEGAKYVEVSPANCSDPAKEGKKCVWCNDAVDQDSIRDMEGSKPNGNHVYEKDANGAEVAAHEVAATCTVPKHMAKTCTVCKKDIKVQDIEGEVVDPNAHVYEQNEDGTDKETTVAATCTKKEHKTKHCTACDKDIEVAGSETGELAPDNHKYVQENDADKVIEVPGNCTYAAHQAKHCELCDKDIPVSTPAAGDGTSHVYEKNADGTDKETTVAATCAKKAHKTKHCTVCDEDIEVPGSETGDLLTAYTDHNFGTNAEVEVPATCTKPAHKTKLCTVCNKAIEVPNSETGVAGSHTFGAEPDTNLTEKTNAANCAHGTQHLKYCTSCEEWIVDTTDDDMDPNSHEFETDSAKKIVIPATCMHPQLKVYPCKNFEECGKWDTAEGKVEEIGAVDETKHEWGETVTLSETTCYAYAGTVQYCTNPAHKDNKSIVNQVTKTNENETELKAHTPVELKAVEATCKTPGKTAGEECSVCKKVITAQTETAVNPDGHKFIVLQAFRAETCKENGLGKVQCEYCKKTEYQTIEAHHIYSETPDAGATEADCVNKGVKQFSCKRMKKDADGNDTSESACDDPETALKVVETEPLGHHLVADDTQTDSVSTCIVAGKKHLKCDRDNCTYTEVQDLPLASHNYVEKDMGADCVSPKRHGSFCSVCNAQDPNSTVTAYPEGDPNYVAPLGHQLSVAVTETAKAATCMEAGIGYKTCTRDNCPGGEGSKEEVAITKLSHSFVKDELNTSDDKIDYIKETCTTAGKYVKHCTGNGVDAHDVELTATEVEAANLEAAKPALTHDIVDVEAVPSTCTTKGHAAGKACSREGCGYVVGEMEELPLDPDNHVWETTEAFKEATCANTGLGKVTCKECGESKYDTLPSGHVYGEPTVTPATCTTEGSSVKTCARQVTENGQLVTKCDLDDGNKTVTEVLPALGHAFDAGTVTIPATCAATGVKTKTCTRGCGATETEEIPKLTTHGEMKYDIIPATCTEAKMVGKSCTLCHAPSTVPADAPVVVTDANLDELAVKVAEARGLTGSESDYDAQLEQIKAELAPEAAKGHTLKHEVTTEATCTEAGEETITCENCDYKVEHSPIKAKGHTIEDRYTPATCTENAKTTPHCTVCDYEEDPIDLGNLPEGQKLGHDMQPMEGGIFRPATCTVNGLGKLQCSRCPVTEYGVIEAKHTYGEWDTTTTPATCYSVGKKTRVCSVCSADTEGHIEEQEIAMIPHNYGSQKIHVIEAGCGNAQSVGKQCEVCKYVDGTVITAENKDELLAQIIASNGWVAGTDDSEINAEEAKLIAAAATEAHTAVETQTKAPTCWTDGEKTTSCSVCKAVLKTETVKGGHTYTTVHEDATCTTAGKVTETCSVCEEGDEGHQVVTLLTDLEPALNHKNATTKAAVAATCKATGLTEGKYCPDCQTDIVEQEVIPADVVNGHDYAYTYNFKEGLTEAEGLRDICENGGTASVLCKTCNGTVENGEKDNVTIEAGHVFKPVTFTGGVARVCDRCNETEIIFIKDGYTYCATCAQDDSTPPSQDKGVYKITEASKIEYLAPTCTVDGHTAGQVCPQNPAHIITKSEIIAATGHTQATGAEAWTIKKEATCKEEGSRQRHCSVCDQDYGAVETIPVKTTHNYVETFLEATCTNNAMVVLACKDCKTRKEGEEPIFEYENTKDPNAHVYGEDGVCTECGASAPEGTAYCPTCKVWGEVITEKGTAATCTTGGTADTVKCKAEGHKISGGTETEPLGHTQDVTEGSGKNPWDFTGGKEPSCAEEGSGKKRCTRCGAIYGTEFETVPKLEHVMPEDTAADAAYWTDIVEATCVKGGSKVALCKNGCGEKLKTVTTPATGVHDYQEDYHKPTCSANGWVQVKCTGCDDVKAGSFVDFGDADPMNPDAHEFEGDVCKHCKKNGSELAGWGKCSVHGWTKGVVIPAVDATCSTAGKTEGLKCPECGEIFVAQETVEATGIHVQGTGDKAWKVITAATCGTPGAKKKLCKDCNQPFGDEVVIEPTGEHNYQEDYHEETCELGAWVQRKCSVCQAIEEDSYEDLSHLRPALGHKFVDGICENCHKADIASGSTGGQNVVNGKEVVTFTSKVDKTDPDMEVISYGMLYITAADYAGNARADMTFTVNEADGTYTIASASVRDKAYTSANVESGNIADYNGATVNIGLGTDPANKNRTLYARGYVIVKKDGKYSVSFDQDITTGSYNSGFGPLQ